MGSGVWRLGAMELDDFPIDSQAFFLVYEKVSDGCTLIALELDHVAGFFIADNGSIAGKLFLDDSKNFLEVKFGRDTLDSGQGLAAIALLDTNMDIGWSCFSTGVSGVLVLRIRKGIESLEVLDLRGHTMY